MRPEGAIFDLDGTLTDSMYIWDEAPGTLVRRFGKTPPDNLAGQLKEMGRLDFAGTTRECVNRVRAMSPWPCAFVPLAEGALKVWSAAAFNGASGVPGTVLRANKRDGLVVATGDGALSLLEVQAPNARRMDAKAFLLGHPIPEGTMLDEVRL